MSDFETQEEALKVADDLIAQSKEDFGFEFQSIPHNNPLLERHFYKASDGKVHTVGDLEKKVISGSADVKPKGALLSIGDAKEITGGTSCFDRADVKLEFPHLDAVQKSAETLRSFGANFRLAHLFNSSGGGRI